jgi:hypothetical protein
MSELREEIGAAKASADAAKVATSDAKSAVAEDAPDIVDPESMTKDVQCMKYEKKKPKSHEFSEVVPSFDPSILRELRDEIAYAKGAAEDAKATADEGKNDSADAKDAASDTERDATSTQDAAYNAKNAVDSVQSTIADII